MALLKIKSNSGNRRAEEERTPNQLVCTLQAAAINECIFAISGISLEKGNSPDPAKAEPPKRFHVTRRVKPEACITLG
jgi:hypothetical protein